MEDQAIGGGAGSSMGPSAAEKADNSGPLEQRIVSKNWSVRANAFEELLKLCQAEQPNSKKDFFGQHVDQWKVYLKDSNPGALEKALVCLEAFLDKIRKQVLMDSQNEIITMLVEKCLSHVKPVIKQKAQECLLIMFEVSENFQDSYETLNKLATNKVPKVAASGTVAIAVLIENFGIKKMKVAEFAENMLKNAQHTNPAVKNAAYEFYKATYKWIGDAILPQIEEKLKKAQMDDLNKLFAEVKEKGDKSKRVVRSEKAAAEEEAKNAAIDAAMEEEKKQEEEVVDALEFAPEVDILPTFTIDWCEATAGIKKWNEKKDKLEEIVTACKNKKVKPGHFDNLTAFLKKEIAATNINTSLAAIKASSAIGEGMREPFGSQIKILLPAVLQKFKEKRQIVQDECLIFCDVAIKCSDLEELKDEYIPAITDKAPGVKTGTLKFIEKAALVTYIDKLQNIAPDLLPAMVKAIEDKDAGVRETALHCMGILKGRLGDGVTSKYLKDINKQKEEKINEASGEIKPSKYDRPKNWKPPKPKATKKKVEEPEDDEDSLMNLNAPSKPLKKPPPGLGKKPVKKVQKDVEMKNEEEKKAPASSTTKKTVPTKGPSAPVIQEEDLGAGLSKEEAEEKVAEFFSADVVSKFDSAKWQEKKEGFEGLKEEIKEKQPSKVIIEAVAKFVKAKMKDFKESNINLMKGTVDLWLCFTQSCDSINKRTMQCAMQFFVDKIGDVKMSTAIKEMLMNASELVSPKFISLQIIKYAATAKAPNTIKESCNMISDMIDDFGMGGFPLKEIIDFAKVAVAHATPAVRQAAIKLFTKIYQHAGEAIRNFMGEIKESTTKLIDAELKTITPYKKGEHEKKRHLRGQDEEEVKGDSSKPNKKKVDEEDDLLACLPREDISKKLNSKLLESFKHKDWKIRKKAGEDTEQILKDAKMRIENNGLVGLMDCLKNGMKDPNKAVVKVFINLLGLLAEAIGSGVKQYGKKCFVPMLANLSDKQSLVRADVVAAINKWSDQVGAEYCINHLCQLLSVENPEGRTESLKWILEHENSIKDVNDPKEMIKPLMSCLTDKSKPIRESTEKVIGVVMPIVGYQEFLGATKDFKTAVQQTLKPILERIKSNMKDSDVAPAKPADNDVIKPKQKAEPVEEVKVDPSKNSFAKLAVEKKKPIAPPVSSSRKNKAVEEDGLNIKPLNKANRAKLDSRTKYPLNEVKGDHVEKLQNFCQDAFGLKFHDLMFEKAQNFEKHIKCVKQFDGCIATQPDEILEVLDIIFKWCNLRVNESSNTQLITSILDFYANLFTMFIEKGYQMQEFEALVCIGTICDKSGINNKVLQEKVRKLVKMCYEVYDKKATLRIILDKGVKNQNQKSVAECLDLVAQYVQENGPDHINSKDYKLFIQCADAKDASVRENSLKTFGELYKHIGDSIQSFMVKDVPPKVKDLLEERFKRIQKQQGKPLNSSINSNKSLGPKQDNKRLTSTNVPQGMKSPIDRKSMVPQTSKLQNSLGGFKKSSDLQFNRKNDSSAQKGMEPEVDHERVRTKMDHLDIQDSMSNNPQDQEEEKMQIDQQADLQNVFTGKTNFNQEDVSMENAESREDNAAQEIGGKGHKPNKQDRPNNEDEIAEMLRKAEEMDLDPAVKEQQENILKHIRRLKIGDLLERVDSLVALNEIISTTSSSNQAEQTQDQKNQLKALIYCCNQLINAFTVVMKDIFRHQVQDIPLRFTKYFITIVNKSCSSKEIMREVSEQSVHDLVEQLLTRLLIDNLDKIGQNKEGELILKNLNSSMLRMLENCNHTYVFGVLFGLLKKSKEDNSLPKLPGLIIKCLLKLSKIMDKLIEKMDMQKFLVAIHEYLVTIDHENKTQNDDLGVRIVKTLVNEVVKLKQEKIWESYTVIENHPQPDNHIKKWVQIIIRSLPIPNDAPREQTDNKNSSMGGVEQAPGGSSRMMTEFEFKKIVKELRENHSYEQGIQRLDKFTKSNPQYDFKNNLRKESDQFAQKVVDSLYQFQMGYSGRSTNNSDSLGGRGQPQDVGSNSKTDKLSQFKANLAKQKLNTSSSSSNMMQLGQSQSDLNRSQNKMSAFDQKMAKLQQKTGAAQTGRFSTMVGQSSNGQQNLNTSISAMNQKLSQKWSNMSNNGKNKIGGLTGRQPASNTNLSQTLNTGMGQNQLNTSNNKFQSKIQGSFASRVQQNKLNTSNNANANFNNQMGNQAQTPGQSSANVSQISQQQNPQSASKIGGGISSNSFRSKFQPRMSANPVMGAPSQGGIGAHTNMPQSTGLGGQQTAASSQDLQKRLADMKAKLQGLKKGQ